MNLFFISAVIVFILLVIIVLKNFYAFMRAIKQGEENPVVMKKQERIVTLVMWGYVILVGILVYAENEIQSGASVIESIIHGCYNMFLFFLNPRWLILIGMYVFLFVKQKQ